MGTKRKRHESDGGRHGRGSDGNDKNFLSYCQHLIRENFMYRFQSPELNYMNLDEASFSVKFSPFVNERNVIDLMEELAKAERHITQNVNAKMVFFDLSLRITVLIKR